MAEQKPKRMSWDEFEKLDQKQYEFVRVAQPVQTDRIAAKATAAQMAAERARLKTTLRNEGLHQKLDEAVALFDSHNVIFKNIKTGEMVEVKGLE